MSGVKVHFLGSGDAFSSGGSHQAGYLVSGEGSTTLLDCGATTLRAMKNQGVDPVAVDRVLISHLHGDHFAGLPFLFLQYLYESRRDRPLQIVGPPGTQERVFDLYRAMYRDTAGKPVAFGVEFVEMRPGQPVELGPLRIEAFAVPHQENDLSFAYRVAVGGRRILYSGDTGWTEDLIRHAEGTDLFICECCYFESRFDFHLDYPRIAEEQHRFATRRLVLTHLGREVHQRRREIELTLAQDGLVLDV